MSTEAPRIPERDALLKAVAEIGPLIEANAARSEELRHLPPESVEALDAADLFSFIRPREVGGFEADPVTQHEVIEALAYFDPSAAWCAFIGAGSSAFAAAMVPDDGFDEIRSSQPAGSPWPRCAGSPSPTGRAEPVDGGYRLSGRWGWASGIQHSDWVFAGGAILKDGEPEMTPIGIPNAKVMVMPKSDLVVEDTWHTAGLRGTGSTHFSCDGVFVPEHRTLPFPFPVAHRGGELFRLPLLGFFGPAFSGFPQGVGRRAIDDILAFAVSKQRVGQTTTVADRGAFRHDTGVADGRLRSAGTLVRHELEQLWHRLHSGTDASALDSARLLQSFTNNAQAAAEVTEYAYRYAGGDAVFTTNPFQRYLRDLKVASQHILVGDHNHEAVGTALLAAGGG